MTPRELWIALEAYNDRLHKENEARIVQAYMTARFYRMKKMPSLKQVLRDMQPKKPSVPQTPEQMLAFAKQFQAKLERKE